MIECLVLLWHYTLYALQFFTIRQTSTIDLEHNLNSDLINVCNWSTNIHLTLNFTKYKCMIMRSSKKISQQALEYGSSLEVENFPYLG